MRRYVTVTASYGYSMCRSLVSREINIIEKIVMKDLTLLFDVDQVLLYGLNSDGESIAVHVNG